MFEFHNNNNIVRKSGKTVVKYEEMYFMNESICIGRYYTMEFYYNNYVFHIIYYKTKEITKQIYAS